LKENLTMLRLAIVFFAIVAAFLAFGGGATYSWAEVLFEIFLILVVLSFLGRAFGRQSF
jgi:uncharacterized membrane protein YtjA (UPF0391 family)